MAWSLPNFFACFTKGISDAYLTEWRKMVSISPFRAVRPAAGQVEQISSVPYDVVSRAEVRELIKGNEDSFLRVIRSDGEFSDEVDAYSESVYAQAKQNYLRLKNSGAMQRDSEDQLYVYQLEREGHVQTGLVCCISVDDYASGRVKLHEKTRPVKENDRVKHMQTLGAQPGPVFLAYRGSDALKASYLDARDDTPVYDFKSDDGVRHTVWRVRETAAAVNAFSELDAVYVADGHHRAASAYRTAQALKDKAGGHDRFLAVLFPHQELAIMAYNRVLRSLPAGGSAVLFDSLKAVYEVCEVTDGVPKKKGNVCCYVEGSWYELTPKADLQIPDDPVEQLDVAVLQSQVLAPIFGIDDPRTHQDIDFVGGIRGTKELERLVDSGDYAVAFSMYPVAIEELLTVADMNRTMPPKSTWFEPKLRSGLFVHEFE